MLHFCMCQCILADWHVGLFISFQRLPCAWIVLSRKISTACEAQTRKILSHNMQFRSAVFQAMRLQLVWHHGSTVPSNVIGNVWSWRTTKEISCREKQQKILPQEESPTQRCVTSLGNDTGHWKIPLFHDQLNSSIILQLQNTTWLIQQATWQPPLKSSPTEVLCDSGQCLACVSSSGNGVCTCWNWWPKFTNERTGNFALTKCGRHEQVAQMWQVISAERDYSSDSLEKSHPPNFLTSNSRTLGTDAIRKSLMPICVRIVALTLFTPILQTKSSLFERKKCVRKTAGATWYSLHLYMTSCYTVAMASSSHFTHNLLHRTDRSSPFSAE